MALTALIVALSAALASAAPTPLSFSPIDGSSTGVSFTKPSGVAIDEVANPGNVLLSDSSAGAVDVFGPEGEVPPGVASPYQLTGFSFNGEPSGVAIDNSASASEGDLYVAAAGGSHVTKYELNGSEEYELAETLSATPAFGEVLGVGVDPTSGNVWIADYNNGLYELSPTGTQIEQITATTHPSSVAVDSAGDLFVQQYESGAVFKYAANGSGEVEAGATPTQIVASGATGVAVDTGFDTLVVAKGDRVVEYDAISGAEGGEFGSGTLSSTERLAVNSQTHNVYVADKGNGEIDAFGPLAPPPPTATTNPATAVHHTSAVLNGHLDPKSDPGITNCQFDWVDDAQFQIDGFASAATVDCNEGDSFAAPADVSANLGNLTPGTEIHFRLDITTTSSGDVQGSAQSFTPAPFPLTRNQIATFGPDGTAATAFNNPEALAVDPSGGDLYVIDSGANTLSKFDSSGAPSNFSALGTNVIGGFRFEHPSAAEVAIDASGTATDGDIYVADSENNLVKIFAADGNSLGTLDGSGASPVSGSGICGVAVDPAGKVYVAHFQHHIDRYVPSANPVTESDFDSQISTNYGACMIAADSAGSLYVANWGAGEGLELNKYLAADFGTSSTGTVVAGAERATAVSVDPSNDDVYVAEGQIRQRVVQFNSAGIQLATIGAGVLSNPHGVAVQGSGGNLYASDSADRRIHVFGPPVALKLPTITPGAPAAITPDSATLNAKVDPEGFAVTDCHFEYGTTTAYGQSAPCAPNPGSGSGDVSVSAVLTGLTPQATYHFRIVASNANNPGTATGPDQTLTTTPAVKDLITNPATAVTAISATLNGSLDPDGVAVSDCHFDYVDDAHFQASGFAAAAQSACVPDPGSASVAVAVAADLSGLNGGTTYHFRLQATNSFGTTIGNTLTFKTSGPVISVQSVEDVSFSDATLSARINPEGASTTYHLEYGTTASYGQSTLESLPVGFAGDETSHTVSVHIGGLNPGIAYHFRFVAANTAGTSNGLDTTFTTYSARPAFGPCSNDELRGGPGARLADCRAYEQATPVDKHGASVQGAINLIQASGAGDRITFYLNGGLPASGGTSVLTAYMASRAAGAWSSDGLLPATDPGLSAGIVGWSNDLSTTLDAGPGPGNVGQALYLRDSSSGAFQLGPANPGEGLSVSALAAFAADTSHLIFENEDVSLVPGAVPGKDNLYELDHGVLTLAGRIPSGSATSCDDESGPACIPAPEGSFAGPYDWMAASGNQQSITTGGAKNFYYTQNTISRDGSRVFFTAAGSGQLYVREDDAKTTQVSASQRATPDPNGHKPAAFMAATPDGSKVFFLSCEKLTDDSTAVSTAANSCTSGQDLYSYDVGTGELTDLSVDSSPGDPGGAAVAGVLGASDDGSYVYFVAPGVLASGASPGANNLYVSHDGTIAFIALLGGGDPVLGGGDPDDWSPRSKRINAGSHPKLSRVSSDGRALLFSSERSLTGYANAALVDRVCGSAGQPCTELFRYSAPTGKLDCVSCNPTGRPPSGQAALGASGDFVVNGPRASFLTRNLSADGNRVFFDSPDPLLASDINGVGDVYEWEAKGSGSCESESQNGGCLYLISSGTSPDPSSFADASENGDDAFFFTSQSLVPSDGDHLIDIYDASVGGGLPSQHSLAPPTCTSTACQANPAPPPEQTPASAAFSGPGNVHEGRAARRCPKGKRKVRHAGKVRCQKAHKQHKRHNNRGGSK